MSNVVREVSEVEKGEMSLLSYDSKSVQLFTGSSPSNLTILASVLTVLSLGYGQESSLFGSLGKSTYRFRSESHPR